MMDVAQVMSNRSTCSRLHVGAIVARDYRIISTGYNGVSIGEPHCNHMQSDTKCTDAVHAEANAIIFAAKHGVSTMGADLYVTHAPCHDCAKLIVNAGLMRVYYKTPYRLTDGVDLLKRAGLLVERLYIEVS
jgi:dCMP deaminase